MSEVRPSSRPFKTRDDSAEAEVVRQQSQIHSLLHDAPEMTTPAEFLTEFSDLIHSEANTPSRINLSMTERRKPKHRLRRLMSGVALACVVILIAGGVGVFLSRILLSSGSFNPTPASTPDVSATSNPISVDPSAGNNKPRVDAAGLPAIDSDSVGTEVVQLINTTTTQAPVAIDINECLRSLDLRSNSLLTLEAVSWAEGSASSSAWLIVTTLPTKDQSLQNIRDSDGAFVFAVVAPANCGTGGSPAVSKAIWQGVIVYNKS